MNMDPREVLLGINLDELAEPKRSARSRRSVSNAQKRENDDVDLVEQVKRLRRTVEHDHDQRLRGIEINIRWLMVLVGGEVLAIVGFALSSVASV